MTVLDFPDLKQQIVARLCANNRHGQILNELKEFYKDVIDSPRRFEQITKISHLFNILEIRDILSKDDIEPLKETASRLNNQDLLQKLNEYEAGYKKRENLLHYASVNTTNSSNRQQLEIPMIICPFGIISERKRQRIFNTVIEEIGSYWRDLARNLKIREGKIDEIEINNDTLANKASKLMEEYIELADPQRWFFTLCNALEKTRRKDLSKSLQNIITMNI